MRAALIRLLLRKLERRKTLNAGSRAKYQTRNINLSFAEAEALLRFVQAVKSRTVETK